MRQRILGSHTPPCHRRMVITTQFSVLPCCTAAQTSSVSLQVAFDCLRKGEWGAMQHDENAGGATIFIHLVVPACRSSYIDWALR